MCWLLVVCDWWLLFVVRDSLWLVDVSWMFIVVCGSFIVARFSSFGVCCCPLRVACCVLVVGC